MIDTDPLAAAFASFKEDAVRDLIAPGSARARRTVTHRRLGTGIAAAMAVLAVIVTLGAVHLLGPRDQHQSAKAAATLDVGGTVAGAGGPASLASGVAMAPGLSALSEIAGLTPSSASTQSTMYGGYYGVINADGVWSAHLAGHPITTGSYAIDSTCYGTGIVNLTWTAGTSSGPITLSCSTADTVIATEIVVGADALGQIHVSVANPSSADPIGFAFVVTKPAPDPNGMTGVVGQAGATADNASHGHAIDSSSNGLLSAPVRDADAAALPHRRTMEYVCVGGGSTTVRWTAGGKSVHAVVPCHGTAHRFTLTGNAPGMSVEITPDLDATGRAAYAYEDWIG